MCAVVAADHRAPARQHRLQTDHVGARAVEHGKHLGPVAEVLDDELLQALGVDVPAVGDLVPLVGGRDGGEHLWVDARVVVAREAAERGIVQPKCRVESRCHG